MYTVSWKASAVTPPRVGLWLNASKSESMLESDDFYPLHVRWLRIDVMSRIITGRGPRERKRYLWSRRLTILEFGGDKSFVDDLNTEQGAVSSRVALLLRSAEAKPMLYRFVSCLQCDSGQLVFTSKKYFSPSRPLTTSTVVQFYFNCFFSYIKTLNLFSYLYYFSLLLMINWLGPTLSYTKILTLILFPFFFLDYF